MVENVTPVGQLTTQKQKEVKKHVAAIHCSNTFSLLQRKINNALLYYAYPNLVEQEEHTITVKQLCNLIGYNGNNQLAIKEALRGLVSTLIEWNVTDQQTGEEDWTASTVLASVRIKGPMCKYAYSPRMRELLYSPVMYGKINLIVQARFNSSYGLALYENCVRFKGLPYTKWFELATFRKLMGVAENTYSIFRDFKKRVLDKSIEEVNTFSDLLVEPEIKREGRAVTNIRFKLKEREKKKRLGITPAQNEESDLQQCSNELLEKLRNQFGFSLKQVGSLLELYDEKIIWEKIRLVESSRSFLDGKIKNLSGYLFDSLKNDYQKPVASSAINTIQNRNNSIDTETQEKILSIYESYLLKEIIKKFEKTDLVEQSSYLEKFDVYLKKEADVLYSIFCEEGLSNPLISHRFCLYVKDYHKDFCASLLSFEEFTLSKNMEGEGSGEETA